MKTHIHYSEHSWLLVSKERRLASFFSRFLFCLESLLLLKIIKNIYIYGPKTCKGTPCPWNQTWGEHSEESAWGHVEHTKPLRGSPTVPFIGRIQKTEGYTTGHSGTRKIGSVWVSSGGYPITGQAWGMVSVSERIHVDLLLRSLRLVGLYLMPPTQVYGYAKIYESEEREVFYTKDNSLKKQDTHCLGRLQYSLWHWENWLGALCWFPRICPYKH